MSGAHGGGELRRVLFEFYSKHNPDKLDTIDKILATYKGKEASLIRSLEKKYAVKIDFAGDGASAGAAAAQQPTAPTANAKTTGV